MGRKTKTIPWVAVTGNHPSLCAGTKRVCFPHIAMDSGGHTGTICINEGGGGDMSDFDKRAHLIAAAPEMQDALQSLWDFICELGDNNPGWLAKIYGINFMKMNEAYIKAPNALLKSKGLLK